MKIHISHLKFENVPKLVDSHWFWVLDCHRYLGNSNFLGSIGSQKGAENVIFLWVGHLKPPPPCGRVKVSIPQGGI